MPNSDTDPSSAILINSYEIPRIKTKLLQTFFGGIVIGPRRNVPLFLILQQLCIFTYPLIVCVIFTALYELNFISQMVGSVSCGCTTLAVSMTISISLIAVSFVRRYDLAERTSRDLAGEEDGPNFKSCFGIEALEFLFNMLKPIYLWFLHPLFGALAVSLSYPFLLPTNLLSIFNSYWISIPIHVLGLLSVCIAHYSTVAKAPPEPAQFGSTNIFYIEHITRSVYIIMLTSLGLLARFYPAHEHLQMADMISHLLFPFLPIYWLFGLIPPLNALLFWLIDFVLIHVCGVSPAVGIHRNFVAMVVCVLHTLIVCLVDDMALGVVIASCLSCILSLDVVSFIIELCQYAMEKSVSMDRSSYDISYDDGHKKTHCRSSTRKAIILKIILVVICLIASGFAYPSILIMNAGNGVYIAASLGLLLYLSTSLQSRYLVFGVLKNPLFTSMKKTQSFIKLFTCANILPAVFFSLSRVVVPILMVWTGASYLSADRRQWSSYFVRIAIVRFFKSAWHYPMGCVIDLIILRVTFSVNIFNSSLGNYSVIIQLMIIAILRKKFIEFMNKIWMVLLLSYHAVRDPKQRHRLAAPIAGVSFCLSPLVLLLTLIAAILSAPLLPIFTLPLFLIGFPRPQSFWPSAVERQHSTNNNDWVYYKHAEDSLITMMHGCFYRGKLGLVCPGDMFLVRFQDRFIWVIVAEVGFTYTNIITKGLELQETSCHATEAADVDDMFEECLYNDNARCLNTKYIDHALTPKDVGCIYTYSDAKNVLTGIIDQKGLSKRVGKMFLKTLLWLTLRHCVLKSNVNSTKKVDSMYSLNSVASRNIAALFDPRCTDNKPVPSGPSKKDSTAVSYQTKSSEKSVTSTADLIDNETNVDVSDGPITSNYGLPATDQHSTKCVGMKNSIKHNAQEMELKSFQINIGTDRPDGDDEFDDFGFDDENDNVADKTPPLRKESSVNNPRNTKLKPGFDGRKISRGSCNTDSVSSLSKYIDLPVIWKRSFSGSLSGLMPMTVKFPVSWYKFILESFELHRFDNSLNQNALLDQSVMSPFCQFIMWCYFIVEVAPYSLNNEEQDINEIQHMLRCYQCDFPWSVHLHHLTKDKALNQLVQLAYRYAFKIVLDECVLGDKADFNELNEALVDLDTNWYIGSDDSKDWIDSVNSSTPHLFTIGHDPIKGTVSSRTLSLQHIPVAIGALQTEMVKSIWASSAFELLYLVNDDEERYSIQSHPAILRNLTVQASDPPIGYPIQSSGLINKFTW